MPGASEPGTSRPGYSGSAAAARASSIRRSTSRRSASQRRRQPVRVGVEDSPQQAAEPNTSARTPTGLPASPKSSSASCSVERPGGLCGEQDDDLRVAAAERELTAIDEEARTVAAQRPSAAPRASPPGEATPRLRRKPAVSLRLKFCRVSAHSCARPLRIGRYVACDPAAMTVLASAWGSPRSAVATALSRCEPTTGPPLALRLTGGVGSVPGSSGGGVVVAVCWARGGARVGCERPSAGCVSRCRGERDGGGGQDAVGA